MILSRFPLHCVCPLFLCSHSSKALSPVYWSAVLLFIIPVISSHSELNSRWTVTSAARAKCRTSFHSPTLMPSSHTAQRPEEALNMQDLRKAESETGRPSWIQMEIRVVCIMYISVVERFKVLWRMKLEWNDWKTLVKCVPQNNIHFSLLNWTLTINWSTLMTTMCLVANIIVLTQQSEEARWQCWHTLINDTHFQTSSTHDAGEITRLISSLLFFSFTKVEITRRRQSSQLTSTYQVSSCQRLFNTRLIRVNKRCRATAPEHQSHLASPAAPSKCCNSLSLCFCRWTLDASAD